MKVIYNAMIKSQFNYCPLVWMFCSRKSNNLVNEAQERALSSTYKENNETSIHERNLEFSIAKFIKFVHYCIICSSFEKTFLI